MLIVLVDAEREYVAVMTDRIRAGMPDVRVQGCASPDEIPIPGDSGPVLCIFNPADFPDLPQRFGRRDPSSSWEFWSMQLCLPANSGCGSKAAGFARLGPVSRNLPCLRAWVSRRDELNEAPAKSQPKSTCPDTVQLLAGSPKPAGNGSDDVLHQVTPSAMHLLFSFESSGYRPEISRLRLLEMASGGRKVIYLPIMPTYQMTCLAPPGQGPSMTDLLMMLLGRNIEPGQLGQYLQLHPDGYLQFRPPERSDDLVLCSQDLLRQLVSMLRRRLASDAEPCSVLIDCAGIPLATVGSLAVLCDSCEFCLPDKDNYASQSAGREAGSLLALLPSHCQARKIVRHQDGSVAPFMSRSAL